MDFSQTNQNDPQSKRNSRLEIVSDIGNPALITANMQKCLGN